MNLLQKFRETAWSVLPVMGLVLALGLLAVPAGAGGPWWLGRFLVGGALLVLGLTVFLLGVDLGIRPMGERCGAALTRRKSLALLLAAAFVVGLVVTAAEPDIQVFGDQVRGVFPAVRKAALTFAIAGGAMAFLNFNNKANELNRYKSEGTISGYIQAINVDATDYDSYSQLVDKIDKDIDVILPGELSDTLDPENVHGKREMYIGELQKAISSETMSKLREKNIKSYVKVNYDVGLLILNKFSENKDSEATNTSVSFKNAVSYFEKVVAAVEDNNNNYDACGLDDKQYYTAAYYYLIGYFRDSENQYKSSQVDEKGKFTVNETVKNIDFDFIKVEDDGTMPQFYPVYWELIQRSTDDTENDERLSSKAKLNLIYMNSNTTNRLIKEIFITSNTKDHVTLRPSNGVESYYSKLVSTYYSAEKVINSDLDKSSDIYKSLSERLSDTKQSINSLRDNLRDMYEKYDKPIDLEEIK